MKNIIYVPFEMTSDSLLASLTSTLFHRRKIRRNRNTINKINMNFKLLAFSSVKSFVLKDLHYVILNHKHIVKKNRVNVEHHIIPIHVTSCL